MQTSYKDANPKVGLITWDHFCTRMGQQIINYGVHIQNKGLVASNGLEFFYKWNGLTINFKWSFFKKHSNEGPKVKLNGPSPTCWPKYMFLHSHIKNLCLVESKTQNTPFLSHFAIFPTGQSLSLIFLSVTIILSYLWIFWFFTLNLRYIFCCLKLMLANETYVFVFPIFNNVLEIVISLEL